MLKCPQYGTMNNDGAHFCMNCGYNFETGAAGSFPQTPIQQPIQPIQPFQQPIVKNSKGHKAAKGCLLSFVIVVFAILALLIVIIATSSNNSDNDPDTTQTQTADTVMEKLTEIGLTKTEAEAIKADLESVGITSISSLKEGSGTGIDELQSYVFEGSGVAGTLTIENRQTYYIGSGSIDLFNKDKGGKLDTIERYKLTSDEKLHFMFLAEDYIKKCLVSPSSADFESTITGSWTVTRKDDVVTVVSYVEAPNAFGAKIRNKYMVQINYSSDTCSYCQLGDQVVYGTYQE